MKKFKSLGLNNLVEFDKFRGIYQNKISRFEENKVLRIFYFM